MMHLEKPWLTTMGKKRGKKKYASAEQKAKEQALAESWKKIVDSHKPSKTYTKSSGPTIPKYEYRGKDSPRIASLNEVVTGAVTIRKPQMYTGTKMVGIGTLHKSNAIPVFTEEEAVSLSNMRR